MNIKLSYAKECPKRYHIYCDGKKIRQKKDIYLVDSAELTLVEQNIVMDKGWWFLVGFSYITMPFGGLSIDLEDEYNYRQVNKISLNGMKEKVEIMIDSSGNIENVLGVDSYKIIDKSIEQLPQVPKRIKRYKIGLVTLCLTIVMAVVVAAILGSLLA